MFLDVQRANYELHSDNCIFDVYMSVLGRTIIGKIDFHLVLPRYKVDELPNVPTDGVVVKC